MSAKPTRQLDILRGVAVARGAKRRRGHAVALAHMNRREPPRAVAALFSSVARAAALAIPGGVYALEALKRAAVFGERARLAAIAPDTLAAMIERIGGGACRA